MSTTPMCSMRPSRERRRPFSDSGDGGCISEGRHLRESSHARSGAGEPAPGTPALRRGSRLDGRRIYRQGRSRAKDKRPALDQLLADAKRRKFDVLVCWRLDRLGRNLVTPDHAARRAARARHRVRVARRRNRRHDASRQAPVHILGAIAEFERERIRERVMAGLQRARAQGRTLGRPKAAVPVRIAWSASVAWPLTDAAAALGVSRSTLKRWRTGSKIPLGEAYFRPDWRPKRVPSGAQQSSVSCSGWPGHLAELYPLSVVWMGSTGQIRWLDFAGPVSPQELRPEQMQFVTIAF